MRSLHTDTRVSVCVCLLSHQFVDLANLLFTFSINRIEGCLNNPLVIFMVATLMSKDRSEESLPRCRFAPNRFQIPLFRFVNDPTHPNDERFAPPSHPLHPLPSSQGSYSVADWWLLQTSVSFVGIEISDWLSESWTKFTAASFAYESGSRWKK